ncbi:MAG TPA: hypothetical protein VIV07_07115 [Sphingomicrobium sp.]
MKDKLSLATAAAFALASVISGPASAQAQPAKPSDIVVQGELQKTKAPDPDEVVCEKQQDPSSRLVSHRVCKTRAEWAEQRRLQQQEIYQIQIQRGCNGAQGC